MLMKKIYEIPQMKIVELRIQNLMTLSIAVDETPVSGMSGDAKRLGFETEDWDDEEDVNPYYHNYWGN